MSEAEISSQDTKAIACQDDAISLPRPTDAVLMLCIQVFFNTNNITWGSGGQQEQALTFPGLIKNIPLLS